MSKKLITWWTFLFLSFIMQSCKNYHYLKHTPAVSNEDGNTVHQLRFSNESMQFITFSDYQINKVNEKCVFFTTKDINHILKANPKKAYSEQFLFMYTNMSIYNNMLGFYYEAASLDGVMKDYGKKPDVDLGNGVVYIYNSGKFNVIDIYKESDNGVVRFINLNNPDEKDPQNKKFHLEVNNLFFDLNRNLWTKNASDFSNL